MIKVVNKYKCPDHIYCGRGSSLGNPFPMKHEGQRNLVCDQYEEWFHRHVDATTFLEISEGNKNGLPLNPQTAQTIRIFHAALQGDVNLGCYCAPKRCHCETIKTFVDQQITKADEMSHINN